MLSEDSKGVAELANLLRASGVLLEEGLSDPEVARVEQTFGIRFPPDLKALLQYALPVSQNFPNWREPTAEISIRERFAWPLEGIKFDIEYNGFWLEKWGPRPEDLATAFEIAHEEVAKAPKLIPIYSHRYLPDEPCLVGNPVLSIYQTDIIYYGSDLANYFENELGRRGHQLHSFEGIREIRFWSRLVS